MAEVDPRLLFQVKPQIDVASSFSRLLGNVDSLDRIRENRAQSELRQQALQQQVDSGQADIQSQAQQRKLKSLAVAAAQVAPMLNSGDIEGARNFTKQRIVELERQGVDSSESKQFLQLIDTNPELAAQRANQGVQLGQKLGVFSGNSGMTAGQRERQSLLNTLKDPNATDEEKQSARIALGTAPRAVGASAKTVDVGGVPHIFDPVQKTFVPASIGGSEVTSQTVGENKADIKQREKFGELTASSRGKAIDSGFEKVASITKNINNIDRAIGALDRGAGTGAAERFFPSIKAATRELNQIQGELALDVVGSTTFGALSEGELNLARSIALDTGMSEPDLKDFLERKKAAQSKLRDYFNEQIQFLDQGGTVAGFLRSKQEESQSQEQPESQDFSGFKIISVDQ
jgi:hypothetical protein